MQFDTNFHNKKLAHQDSDDTTTNSTQEQPKEKKETILSLLVFTTLILAIVLPIRFFVAKPFIVSGTSMFPRFDSLHYLIVDRLTYRFNDPQRGDVITFRYPQNPKRHFLKRIIGLPGETVEMNGHRVIITNKTHPDGFTLNEPYIAQEKRKTDRMTVTLGQDEYFVLGDNRKESADSRYWGPLERYRIVGRVYIQLFPFSKISVLPGEARYESENATTKK